MVSSPHPAPLRLTHLLRVLLRVLQLLIVPHQLLILLLKRLMVFYGNERTIAVLAPLPVCKAEAIFRLRDAGGPVRPLVGCALLVLLEFQFRADFF